MFRHEVENGPDAVFGTEHCYIVRVPATDFDPIDVEARTSGQKTSYEWNYQNIEQSLDRAQTAGKREWWKKRLGF